MTPTQEAAAHSSKISSDTLDQLFRKARTHNAWLPRRVSVETLREIYDLARIGPDQREFQPRPIRLPRKRSCEAPVFSLHWLPSMWKKQKPRRSP